jgi:hypothetical protein
MTDAEKIAITKYDLLYEQRITRAETMLESVAKRLDSMDLNVREGFRELRSDLRWLFGMMMAMTGIILGLMAKGFHWY